jgi:hypothetical protein
VWYYLDKQNMKYFDETEVQVGDVLTIRREGVDLAGVVVKLFQSHIKDAEDWSLPHCGLFEGGGLGLFTTQHLEKGNDIIFVRRNK